MVYLTAGQILDKRYEILELLIDGRVYRIWRAYDKHMERNVAIKTLNDMNRATRLYHEALTSGALEHPHLIPIYDYSVTGDIPYLVMRLVSNFRLSDVLEKTILQTDMLLRLAQGLGDALDYLHKQRLVHGDFRPSNILLDEQYSPYLSNLAVATAIDEKSGLAVNVGQGSRFYMSPEQMNSETIDYRADLYSFGLVLFEAIANRLPFGYASSEDSFAAKQLSNPNLALPSIREFRSSFPIGLDIVLNRLTSFKVSERYRSALEAVKDLTAAFYLGQSNIKGRVFISYATKDKAYVHRLAQELRRLKIDVWIDQDIEKGSDWGDSIEDSLKVTDIMLLILSEASSVSEYVIHEWSFFMGLGKPIYPFVLHSSPPKTIHPRLNRVQHIMGTDDMFNDVARIIEALAGGNPSRIQAVS